MKIETHTFYTHIILRNRSFSFQWFFSCCCQQCCCRILYRFFLLRERFFRLENRKNIQLSILKILNWIFSIANKQTNWKTIETGTRFWWYSSILMKMMINIEKIRCELLCKKAFYIVVFDDDNMRARRSSWWFHFIELNVWYFFALTAAAAFVFHNRFVQAAFVCRLLLLMMVVVAGKCITKDYVINDHFFLFVSLAVHN